MHFSTRMSLNNACNMSVKSKIKKKTFKRTTHRWEYRYKNLTSYDTFLKLEGLCASRAKTWEGISDPESYTVGKLVWYRYRLHRLLRRVSMDKESPGGKDLLAQAFENIFYTCEQSLAETKVHWFLSTPKILVGEEWDFTQA